MNIIRNQMRKKRKEKVRSLPYNECMPSVLLQDDKIYLCMNRDNAEFLDSIN